MSSRRRDPEYGIRNAGSGVKDAGGEYASFQMAGGGATPHASTVPALLRRYRRNVMLLAVPVVVVVDVVVDVVYVDVDVGSVVVDVVVVDVVVVNVVVPSY